MNLMGQGILLTIVGMGVVYFVLWALAFLIRLTDALVVRWSSPGVARPETVSAPPRVEAAVRTEGEDLIPVLAAAVGAYLEAERARVFLVPVARPDRSRWTLEGRVAALSRREGF